MGWNLPPGVTESMIPGNTDRDKLWDEWFEKEIDNIWEEYLDVLQDESIYGYLREKFGHRGDEAYFGYPEFKEYADKRFEDDLRDGGGPDKYDEHRDRLREE